MTQPRPFQFQCSLGAKNEEMAQVKSGKGAPRAQSDTALGPRPMFFLLLLPNATAWHSNTTLLALDQNVISSLLSYNHHLIGKESSVENIAAPRGTLSNAPKLVTQTRFLFSKGKPRHLGVLSSLVHQTWWNFRSSNVYHLRLPPSLQNRLRCRRS